MADEGSGSRQRDTVGGRDDERRRHHHFLIVAYGVQSHINPARALAHRLVRLGDGSVRATLCLTVLTHRRMFPSISSEEQEETDGVVSYVPYSDGLAFSALPKDAEERARSRRAGFESISSVIARLAARGRPVTCVACTMVVLPALDAAAAHGLPLTAYWIQPAHVLAASYHCAHGYGDVVAAHAATDPAYEVSLPGLTRPLRIRDFPSFLVDTTGSEMVKGVNDSMRELFAHVDRRRAEVKLLVNSFDALEPGVLAEVRRHLDVAAVGPMVLGSSTAARIHLFDHGDADRKRYMDWLDAQPEESSVVYVSFGSISKYKRRQMEEIVQGLWRCRRPYLLVLRKDGLEEDAVITSSSDVLDTATVQGMVVEWCDQLEVLSHAAVGCFVTHCGWNSMLEAVVSGVPVVAVPNMLDQPTNAYLAAEEWQIGVRTERDSEGVLTGTELARCVELVMGEESAKASVVRERAKALKGIAREAAVAGGHADRNLQDFLTTV